MSDAETTLPPLPPLPSQVEEWAREIANFQELALELVPQPGERPRLHGIDLYGASVALNGRVGGDHLIYVDFKQRYDLETRIRRALERGQQRIADNLRRCQRKAGLAIVDVSGHRMTDALLAAMLHQSFLLGVIYELDMSGDITRRLFENLNTRFYKSSAAHKFIALTYGEITEEATFRFILAGQPAPVVFSREFDRFMPVSESKRVSFPPLGVMPSLHETDWRTSESPMGFKERYELNEWSLMGVGDLLLLSTDGLFEHSRGRELYFPARLEEVVRQAKDRSARDIVKAVMSDVRAFAPPQDDMTLVVIKRA